MMFLYLAAAAYVFLLEYAMCTAGVQTANTYFAKGKMVATSYMTLKSCSSIKCVSKCFDEQRNTRCSVAGYDKSTQTCFLSNDGPQDLLDADEKSGVFFYSVPERRHTSIFFHLKYVNRFLVKNHHLIEF